MKRSLSPSIQFDYELLDQSAAQVAKEATTHIKAIVRSSYVEIGKALISVREALPHGAFGLWLAAEFGWSDRQARSYMTAVEWSEANSEIISVLSPTVVMQLAAPSTPKSARAAILENAKNGVDVSVKGAKEIIQREKYKARDEAWEQPGAQRRAKMTPEEVKKEDRSKAAKERRRLRCEEELRKWKEEQRRKTKDAHRLAAIIAPLIADNPEAIALLSNIYSHELLSL